MQHVAILTDFLGAKLVRYRDKESDSGILLIPKEAVPMSR
jgi:hypothetical protein